MLKAPKFYSRAEHVFCFFFFPIVNETRLFTELNCLIWNFCLLTFRSALLMQARLVQSNFRLEKMSFFLKHISPIIILQTMSNNEHSMRFTRSRPGSGKNSSKKYFT